MAVTGAGSPGSDDFGTLEARIGHRFRDPALLRRALTHPSYAHEHPPASHNETLAFLGDAVIGLVVAELLAAQYPHEGVGALTQRRALLVSTRRLAAWAVELGIPACLRFGRGEAASGGETKESIRATAFEAVIGVLHQEAGHDAVARLLARLIAATEASDPPSR